MLAELPLEKLFNFFKTGGIFMIPLLLCSFLACAVIVFRGLALRRSAVLPALVESEIERISPGGGTDRLARLVNVDESPLARIVRTALAHTKWPKSENVEAVQTRARHEQVGMETGLVVLEVIVGVGPLLGLLGTLSGLTTVFGALGTGTGAADPRMVAHGIAEALNTTIIGLAVAVPSLVAFSYFSKKVETMSVEMESLVADLLAKCYSERLKPISGVPLPPPPPTVEISEPASSSSPYAPIEIDSTPAEASLPGFESGKSGELA